MDDRWRGCATASSTQVHSGSGSALLGTLQPGAEPNGDSSLAQTVAIPSSGTTTLSFWYRPATSDDLCSGSACSFDWQEAQIRNTAGQTLASVFKSNSNSQTWTQVSFNLDAVRGPERCALVQRAPGRSEPAGRHLDVPGRCVALAAVGAGGADRGVRDRRVTGRRP